MVRGKVEDGVLGRPTVRGADRVAGARMGTVQHSLTFSGENGADPERVAAPAQRHLEGDGVLTAPGPGRKRQHGDGTTLVHERTVRSVQQPGYTRVQGVLTAPRVVPVQHPALGHS